jgi:hypothetical protein
VGSNAGSSNGALRRSNMRPVGMLPFGNTTPQTVALRGSSKTTQIPTA